MYRRASVHGMLYLTHLNYKCGLRTRLKSLPLNVQCTDMQVFIVHCTCLTWATPWTETATPCWVYTCALSIWRVIRLRQILKQIIRLSDYKQATMHAEFLIKHDSGLSFTQFLGNIFFLHFVHTVHVLKFVYLYFFLCMYKCFNQIVTKQQI